MVCGGDAVTQSVLRWHHIRVRNQVHFAGSGYTGACTVQMRSVRLREGGIGKALLLLLSIRSTVKKQVSDSVGDLKHLPQ
jgi:hypothetical protein